jgi:prephenate dehydrogenase
MTAFPTDAQAREAAAPIPVLAVVGVGLIGGSFAAALRRAGRVRQVLGVGRKGPSLERARELGLIDEAVDAAEAAARADLIMLAAPVGAFAAILAEMRDALKPGAIITDAGSTKAQVVRAARAVLGERIACFVPGHPIAGAERIGPDAADPDLYTGRKVVLTPLPENAPADVARVRDAWRACGAQVLDMDADEHDRVLASVSHMPHFLAAVYVAQVARSVDS